MIKYTRHLQNYVVAELKEVKTRIKLKSRDRPTTITIQSDPKSKILHSTARNSIIETFRHSRRFDDTDSRRTRFCKTLIDLLQDLDELQEISND